MKVADAILFADRVAPNDIPPGIKLKWLSDLDQQLVDEVFNRHWGTRIRDFTGYGEDTDINNTELLVQAPYDLLYVDYIEMMIYRENKEIERYNNARLVYERSIARWQNQFNRRFMPMGVPALRF